MTKICVLGTLMVSICGAQFLEPTPAEVDAREAAYRARLELPEVSPARSAAGSVSVAQLRHKPPRRAQKFLERGARLSQAGDHPRAAQEFERAVAADPKFANAYRSLGVEYALWGRYAEAEVEFQRSLTLDPDSLAGHYGLSVILCELSAAVRDTSGL